MAEVEREAIDDINAWHSECVRLMKATITAARALGHCLSDVSGNMPDDETFGEEWAAFVCDNTPLTVDNAFDLMEFADNAEVRGAKLEPGDAMPFEDASWLMSRLYGASEDEEESKEEDADS